MEYEKHIKKLVLGYLKTECKTSYKTFLKIHFPHERKHVPTRVAGQTLEDILRMLSKIQDIVQGHLEDTDYFKEQPAELWSPTHLEEQLLYLLEGKRSSTPTTSVPERSSRSTSASSNHEDQNPISNVEATPEHALPGNLSCDELCHRMATDRKSATNPYFDEMDVSMKLLYDKSFSHNLARIINKQLTPPGTSCNHGNNKTCLNVNEETIKNVINRTESDPAINQLLDDIVADTLEKVILTGAENSLFGNSKQNSNNRTYVDDQINGAVCSILAISQEASTSADHGASINKSNEAPSLTDSLTQTNTNPDGQPVVPEQSAKPVTLENQPQKSCALTVDTQQLTCQTPTGVYKLPPGAVATPVIGSQQQYVIVNQPMNVPQSSQMLQLVPKPVVIDSGQKMFPKGKTGLTEEDIMSMPTLILNDRNEVTYADMNGIQLNTPFKLNEVHNLQEYFKAFGPSEQSPVIKKPTKKKANLIKPIPTIKVEIYKHNAPPKPDEDPPIEVATPTIELPNLNDALDCEEPVADKPDEVVILSGDTPDKIKVTSNDKGLLKSSRSTHTPSPLVTTVRKPTPKSSSHVRNLTFPSPLRKTPKTDKVQSPSKVNKQKATKDLFNGDTKEAAPVERRKTSPRKSASPSKSKRKAVQPAVKKITKKTPKKVTIATSSTAESAITRSSWDAALRKNVIQEEEQKTPARRTSARRRTRKSSELDTSDPDGKKLEEALKTPGKTKTPNPKKSKVEKAKADKKITEESKPEAPTKPENKTVLSPSKLCNTASKRNMEFDGVTPHNPKTVTQQPTMNARKNINSLLETPLKDDVPVQETKEPDPTNSPFTPMLKANLQDLVVGDDFTITTPNFPVTPGLALMENSATNAYYIVDETEHNKAADDIVRSEERKSSTRKTDDDDVETPRSPKVYSRPGMLEAFNKSRAGKKDLDLIEKTADLSDIEEGSEKSSGLSDGESNKTVIRKKPTPQVKEVKQGVKRSQRLSGKSMTVLKACLLDSGDNSIRLNESTNQGKTTNKSLKRTGSSSDSEVVSKEIYKMRTNKDSPNNSDVSKRRNSADSLPIEDPKPVSKEKNENPEITLSSITAEKVKETVSSASSTHKAGPPLVTSVKAEMEEKRRRMISFLQLEKAEECKTPSRRKNANTKRQTPQTSKRKRRVSKNEELEDSEKIDSQDEFFIKSGSNLHRKHSVINLDGRSRSVDAESKKEIKEGKAATKEVKDPTTGTGEVKKPKNVEDDSKEVKEDDRCLKESSQAPVCENPPSPTPSTEDPPFWDTSCTIEEQHHVIDITHNESTPSTKRFEDYDLNRLKKGFGTLIPLHDGTQFLVSINVSDHTTLWTIPAATDIGGSSRRSSSVEARDLPVDSDNENASPRLEEGGELGCAKKRKHRSDSSSSTSSAKRMKASSQFFSLVNDINIETLLTKIHGPTDKT